MYGNHQSMFLQLMALNLLLINRMFASSCFAMSIVLDYIAYDRQNFHLYHQQRYHIFPLDNHHMHFLHFFDQLFYPHVFATTLFHFHIFTYIEISELIVKL